MKKIGLTGGREAIVDDEDYDRLRVHRWYYSKNGYARRNRSILLGHRGVIYMHREVMRAEKGQSVDHVNGCGLDCRKENMRLASQQQNIFNRCRNHRLRSSRFKGVTKANKKWVAHIQKDGVQIHIGRFESDEFAARAYDLVACVLFGEFAWLNFRTTEAARGL